MKLKSKMTKIVTVCHCPNCGTPVKVPIRTLGQLIRKERKNEPTSEFMKSISKKGVLARKQNVKNKHNNQIP